MSMSDSVTVRHVRCMSETSQRSETVNRHASSFLAFRFHHSFLSVLIPLLPNGIWDSLRPGDEWFRKLSNAGQRTLATKVLATTLVIASTGAMLIVGHEAPCHLAALACRSESRHRTDKTENSRQVSGTSDASKTQLELIGS